MITGKQADTGKKKQYTKPGAGQLGRKLANIAMFDPQGQYYFILVHVVMTAGYRWFPVIPKE